MALPAGPTRYGEVSGPRDRPTNRPGNPVRESVRVLGLYVRAQILIAVIETLLYAIGFAIAQVPLWPLFALIGAFCSFIPTFGSLITLALTGVAMLIAERDWTYVAMAFGAWLIVQVVEGFVLQPILLSKPLGLRALPVFLTLIAGSLFFGPIGFLLAVPVLAIANVFWRYYRDSRGRDREGGWFAGTFTRKLSPQRLDQFVSRQER